MNRVSLTTTATMARMPWGAFEAAPDDAARHRVVLDQVASLTDASAITTHTHLTRTGG